VKHIIQLAKQHILKIGTPLPARLSAYLHSY